MLILHTYHFIIWHAVGIIKRETSQIEKWNKEKKSSLTNALKYIHTCTCIQTLCNESGLFLVSFLVSCLFIFTYFFVDIEYIEYSMCPLGNCTNSFVGLSTGCVGVIFFINDLLIYWWFTETILWCTCDSLTETTVTGSEHWAALKAHRRGSRSWRSLHHVSPHLSLPVSCLSLR